MPFAGTFFNKIIIGSILSIVYPLFNNQKKYFNMGNLLYVVAVVLVILWAIGYFGFATQTGGIIHVLLVLAIIAVLLKVIRRS